MVSLRRSMLAMACVCSCVVCLRSSLLVRDGLPPSSLPDRLFPPKRRRLEKTEEDPKLLSEKPSLQRKRKDTKIKRKKGGKTKYQ